MWGISFGWSSRLIFNTIGELHSFIKSDLEGNNPLYTGVVDIDITENLAGFMVFCGLMKLHPDTFGHFGDHLWSCTPEGYEYFHKRPYGPRHYWFRII